MSAAHGINAVGRCVGAHEDTITDAQAYVNDPIASLEGRRSGRHIGVAHQTLNPAAKHFLVEPECIFTLAVKVKVSVEVHDRLQF